MVVACSLAQHPSQVQAGDRAMPVVLKNTGLDSGLPALLFSLSTNANMDACLAGYTCLSLLGIQMAFAEH